MPKKALPTLLKVKPLFNLIWVKTEIPDERTKSGIYLSPDSREKKLTGTVVAVGPGMLESGVFVNLTVKVGDNVIYSKHAGTEVEYLGEKYLVMRETDVFAII